MADQLRREMLRRGSKAIAGIAVLTGTAAASDGNSNKRTGAHGETTHLTKENALSQRQLKQELETISKKHGTKVAANAVPGKINPKTGEFIDGNQTYQSSSSGGGGGGGPEDKENLNYIDTWDHEYKVYGGSPERHLLTTNHFLSMYQSNDTDSEGRYRYFYWHWSQAETNEDYWHDETHLEYIRNYLNIETYSKEVTNFSPASTSDLNGREKDIGVTVGYGGASFGISGSVYVKDATFGPETKRVEKGGAGEFSAGLDANGTQGRQSLNATTVTRTRKDRDAIRENNVEWKTYCEGRQ
jgi:hypothetical protein